MSYFFNFFFSQKLSQIISRPVIEIYILSADGQLAAKQTNIIRCAPLVQDLQETVQIATALCVTTPTLDIHP